MDKKYWLEIVHWKSIPRTSSDSTRATPRHTDQKWEPKVTMGWCQPLQSTYCSTREVPAQWRAASASTHSGQRQAAQSGSSICGCSVDQTQSAFPLFLLSSFSTFIPWLLSLLASLLTGYLLEVHLFSGRQQEAFVSLENTSVLVFRPQHSSVLAAAALPYQGKLLLFLISACYDLLLFPSKLICS